MTAATAPRAAARHSARTDRPAPPNGPGRRWVGLALAGIVVLYLGITVAFSALTPAGEGSDELAHVQYVEYVVQNTGFPRISAANGRESHQPPLYYIVAAGWQDLLRVHGFQLTLPAGVPPLSLSHHYNKALRQAAGHVHQLRVLSILCGLATVLLTFVAARLATRRDAIALAASATVALWPKEIVVSSVVSNDALVIALATLSLVLLLLWLRTDRADGLRSRLLAVDLGLAMGAAVLSSLTALPLVAVALLVMLVVALRHGRRWLNLRLVDPVLAVVGVLIVSGWWFAHNKRLYHDYLAVRASNAYRRPLVPGLISPVSWFNSSRFLHFLPSALMKSVWYDGGWNQLTLPGWLNKVLTAVAAYAVGLVIAAVAQGHTGTTSRGERRLLRPAVTAALAGAVLAGLAAASWLAKDMRQAEGRTAFVGLSAFATILVLGTGRAGPLLLHREGDGAALSRWEIVGLLLWPAVFVAVDLYVLFHFVVPHGGL